VIDFYNAAPEGAGAPVAVHIDVRPALDSFEAAWDRVRMQLGWMASGRWLKE
jgi:cytochrome c heme-lyase